MSFFYASMNSILKILSASVVLSASALFSLNLFGHSASFNHVRPLSLSGLRYRYKSAVSISAASVQFTFHIPRPSNPRWGTFTVIDYEQKDTACHVSFAKLEATLWFFPLLFRVSAGPWMAVKFEDFRVRVWSSTSTPEWVQRIRVNLVGAVLKGQILRCDHFKTTVGLSSLTDTKVAANQDSSTSVEKPGVDRPDFQDEVRVTTYVEGYDVINWLNRLYSFGNLSCQLRKDWIDLRGSFVLIGKEIRWTKVQPPTEKQGRTTSFWWYASLVCIELRFRY